MMLLAVFTVCLAGCYNGKETDDVAYTVIIGVDQAEGGKEKVTYQIVVPKGLSGGDGGSGEQPKGPWLIESLIVPTPADSRMILKSIMSRTPQFSHIVGFIVSEEVARRGIGRNMSYFTNSREFRGSMFVIVVKGSAEEYIKRNSPTLEATLTEFYEEFLASSSESSYFLRATFQDFYVRLKNSGGSPYAVYSSINPMTGEDKPAGVRTPEQKGSPYLAGGIPRTGTENPIDFAGLAVFRGDKMVGVLNSDETRAVALLQGSFSRGNMGVVDPLAEEETVSLGIRSESKPKITAELDGVRPVFNVEVGLEADILGINSGIHYESSKYRGILERQASDLIAGQIRNMIRHTQELGTDPVGFGLYLRPEFRTTGEMEKSDMTALYQAADIRVHVSLRIRRTGLIWRTMPQL